MIDSPRFNVEVEYTDQFPEVLHGLNCSLLISTYQAGMVIVVGVHNGRLQVSYLDFPSAMGIAVSESCIAVGAGRQVHFLYPAHELLETHWRDGNFDAIYIARSSVYTGKIDSHEISWGARGLWLVNTMFSALCTLQSSALFEVQWTPPFIPTPSADDCCHLNGLAMRHGEPAFVSMLAATSTPAGWREHKRNGGCVVKIDDNATVCRGLAMPHSPRWYNGRLWLLNSGTGQMGYVESERESFVAVEAFPGFTRGLSFHEHFAFVGLSRGRESNLFGGLPITESPQNMRCGVGILDLRSGRTVAVLKFNAGVDEILLSKYSPDAAIRCSAEVGKTEKNARYGCCKREIWLL